VRATALCLLSAALYADRTRPGRASRYPAPVLTDDEADEIRRELEAGVRGPVLLKWVLLLVDDRDERLGRARPRRTVGPAANEGREIPRMAAEWPARNRS